MLLDNSIIPIQQYGYTTGKSATDSAMIIDAMDILYTGGVDGFCLASSDSDFTRLAARLRESGMQVIGMGESKTPKAFISACNQFKYLDILLSSSQEELETVTEPADLPSAESEKAVAVKKNRSQSKRTKPKKQEPEPQPQTNLKTIKKAILSLVEECSDDDGWIFSAELGNQLAKRFPDFDVRNFGFSKFTPFINSLGMFDVKRNQANSNSNVQLVYFKLKS